MKSKLFVLASVVFALVSCSQNKLRYFVGHSIFVNNNDVYVAGCGCEGTSLTDRPLLWVNGEERTIGEIGNFNKATSVWVSGSDIYVTMNTEKGAFLWNNGVIQQLATNHVSCEANDVFVNGDKVYIGGQCNGMPVMWIDGVMNAFGDNGCITKIAIHNDVVYAVGYIGDYFNGSPCLWINGEKQELSASLGRANDIAFSNNDVYVAGECCNGAALWKNGQLVFCKGERSCAYAVAVNGNDVYLGGNGFDETLRPIALLWKNGEEKSIPEMKDDIYSLSICGNKLFIAGSTKEGIPLITRDL